MFLRGDAGSERGARQSKGEKSAACEEAHHIEDEYGSVSLRRQTETWFWGRARKGGEV